MSRWNAELITLWMLHDVTKMNRADKVQWTSLPRTWTSAVESPDAFNVSMARSSEDTALFMSIKAASNLCSERSATSLGPNLKELKDSLKPPEKPLETPQSTLTHCATRKILLLAAQGPSTSVIGQTSTS